MKISDIVPVGKEDGQIGVEIEVEGDSLPGQDAVGKYWRKDKDPSLRGESAEYVLKRPVVFADLDRCFKELQKAFEANSTRFRPTYRAGVHVHINVQQLTTIELMNFVFTYLFLEEVMLAYCDKSRQGNHFCLRLSDASFLAEKLTDVCTSENLNDLNTEDLRYASINLTSLFKYGSVEFRALESTVKFDRIKDWAKVLYQLKMFALTVKNPAQLLGEFSIMGWEAFARKALGEFYPIMSPYVTEDRVMRGVRNIQYAVFSKDWDKRNLNIFQNKGMFS